VFTATWNRSGSFPYTLPSRSVVTFAGDVPAATQRNATATAGKTYCIVSRASGKPIGVRARVFRARSSSATKTGAARWSSLPPRWARSRGCRHPRL